MPTKIVNVKVEYIRPQYNNLHEWMKNPNNVYIGRKNVVFINGERFPRCDSVWHNPFKINGANSRNDVIQQYEQYIIKKIEKENLVHELLKLKNKNLGCWCHPEKCHGDVLIKLIKKYDI